jgi:hypothetical protein
MNIALCFCIRNCELYLPSLFNNIQQIKTLEHNVYCIFVYDNCSDNSAILLKNYQQENTNVIVQEIVNESGNRTVRIATARNVCLTILYQLPSIQYHMMIDCDEVRTSPWNIQVIDNYLRNWDHDDWDSISFNHSEYYDIWALVFEDFKHHCWGFGNSSRDVIKIMANRLKYILNHSITNSINVLSAFNGFAIYKTDKFKDLYYNGLYDNIRPLFTDEERMLTIDAFKRYNLDVTIDHDQIECCEHVFYHLHAIQQGCKIKISKFTIV